MQRNPIFLPFFRKGGGVSGPPGSTNALCSCCCLMSVFCVSSLLCRGAVYGLSYIVCDCDISRSYLFAFCENQPGGPVLKIKYTEDGWMDRVGQILPVQVNPPHKTQVYPGWLIRSYYPLWAICRVYEFWATKFSVFCV